MVAPLFYIIMRLLRVEEQEELVSINRFNTLNFHMRLRMCMNRVEQLAFNKAMANNKLEFTRLSVCISTILEFHNKSHKFLGHHCIHLFDIFEILQDLSVAEIKW